MKQEQIAIALLDANVLYSAPVRDLLLHLADVELFIPKWTELIQDEWIRSLLSNRPELELKSLNAAKRAMNIAFPDANVKDFQLLIEKIQLPDADDRHILAAAIHAKAHFIVTANMKHFPQKYLNNFSIQAIHPDDFVTQIFHQNRAVTIQGFNNQVAHLKHPPMTKENVLNSLDKCGLKKIVGLLWGDLTNTM
jgi:predicted nucleic acid-binding protein